ncbi:MAG TPA: fructosamine kinase family protein, partial [Polyangiaceae bacterium]|nr:fructosamine kinase family protein [Polyangiaceae bacterium]
MIDRGLAAALEAALGSRVARATPVAGGDINEAYSVALASGLRIFVKTRRGAAPAMFPAEARGLDWLRAADAVRLPRVLAVSGGTAEAPPFL